MGEDGKKNFNILLILLGLFAHTVNSRPPGTVKGNAIKICSTAERDIYEAGDTNWCCKCPEGYVKSGDCSHGKPATTICVRCPFDPSDPDKQTYMDVENNRTECLKSINKEECLKKMNTRFLLGSYKKNSKCYCDEGYYSSSDAIEYGCNKHSHCDPGHQPAVFGTETTDTKCSNCPAGTYSDVSSPTAMCRDFTKCPTGWIELQGNATHDVVCHRKSKPEESPMETSVYTSVPEIDVEEVKGGDSSINAWFVILPMLGTMLVIAIAVIIYRRRSGTAKGSPSEKDDNDLEITDNTSSEVNASSDIPSDVSTEDVSEGSELLGSGDDGLSSGRGGRTKEAFISFSEAGGSTLRSSRQDTAVIHMTETNIAKKENAGNCSETKIEYRTGKPETTESEIMRLIKEGGLRSIRVKDFTSSIKQTTHSLLKDEEIGREMLQCLKQYSLKRLRPFVGNFLDNTAIEDIQNDHRGDEREIRHRLLLRIQEYLGRRMTPALLLDNTYDKGTFPMDFRDSMREVLFKKLGEVLQNSDLPHSAENAG